MLVLVVLLYAYAAIALAYWLYMAYGALRLNGVARLSRLGAPEPARWPRVSVIVPGCNEADKVGEAAKTLLAEGYPDLELIFVNDRSTDATGEVMDRIAAADPRARVIHIKELPAGWLGKVHALQKGLEVSTGEFVLFTDADVHFEPGTIRLAIAHCLETGLDHLTALPNLYPTNVLLDAALSASVRTIMVLLRPWAAEKKASRAFAGVGAFNLVRRAALDDTPGLEWLRLETGDDAGLGFLLKTHGKSSQFVTAFDRLGLYWHRSFREAARGSEKGWAAALHFSLARAAFSAIFQLALELAPILLLLPLFFGGPAFAGVLGAVVLLVYLVATALIWNWVDGRVMPHLISGLTAPILAAFILRAGWLGWRRGGVLWRGTLYRDEDLKAGMRIHFP